MEHITTPKNSKLTGVAITKTRTGYPRTLALQITWESTTRPGAFWRTYEWATPETTNALIAQAAA